MVRTDRALVFYENEANQAKLWDILSIYAWLDNDIGYVQGLLLSVMILVMFKVCCYKSFYQTLVTVNRDSYNWLLFEQE